jgi:threonine synthase
VYGFIPDNASITQVAEVGLFGQRVCRVNGDYARTKEVASEFAKKNGFLQAGGNLDPMRNEAKKTMVYEWLRLMDEFPTVYMQALSGGTGPLAISKVYREFAGTDLLPKMPRQLLVQSDRCDPMARAWSKAKDSDFPEGWEKDYPIIKDPETIIPTLATGHPKTYPYIGPIVKESEGEIFAYDEKKAIDVARLVAFERAIQLGPAAALPVGGVFKALKEGYIRDGDVVIVLIGEGMRRSPEFMESTLYAAEEVASVEECHVSERIQYRDRLWKPFLI